MDEQQQTAVTISTESYRYAGFWMRFWAYVIDIIIIASLHGIVINPLVNMFNIHSVKILFFPVDILLGALIAFAYFAILTKKIGQTIGKRLFGLKVISKNKDPLTWSTVIFREVVGRYILEAFMITYTLYLIIAFQSKKQGLHDLIAETYVIHEE